MIDVIMCAYNSENTIERAIDSILNQTFRDFNLFVFDDGSTDATHERILGFRDERLNVIRSSKNIGTYAAKNCVLNEFCGSPYIALHDADDFSEPQRFEKQIEFMEGTGDCVCLGTAVREFWTDIEPHTTASTEIVDNERINYYPEVIKTEDLEQIKNLSEDGVYEKYLKFKFCMNGTVMLRAKVMSALYGWDGRTRIGGDTDLFIRILGKNNIYNLQDCLYNRRFHSRSLTASRSLGINSSGRKAYNLRREHVIKKSLAGDPVLRNMEYKRVEYEYRHLCAE